MIYQLIHQNSINENVISYRLGPAMYIKKAK